MGLPEIRFLRARGVQPPFPTPWDEAEEGLYWIARRRFRLDGTPARCRCRVAADRHYRLYVNDTLVARQRNFFSGDLYLYAQEWGDRLAPALRPGENEIRLLLRSDPWRNKHYRCFQPVLWLEACAEEEPAPFLATDETWEVAVLAEWRHHRATATTHHYERIALPPQEEEWRDGIPEPAVFEPARLLKATAPPVYLWTDRPKRTVPRPPVTLAASGTCVLPERGLRFDLGPYFDGLDAPPTETNATPELSKTFVCEGPCDVALATTSMRRHEILLDGNEAGRQETEPDSQQMGLLDVAEPLATFRLQGGTHSLTARYHFRPGGWNELRLAAAGCDALLSPEGWSLQGTPAAPHPVDLDEGERVNAKSWTGPAEIVWDASAERLTVGGGAGLRSAVLDLGMPTTARIGMTFRASSAGTVRLAYGRTLTKGAVDCHAQGRNAVDVLEVPAGMSRFEAVDVRHLRYLDLLFEGFETGVTVEAFVCEEEIYLDADGADWTSDDPRMDAILAASRRTAQLCTGPLYMDNPDREQAQWLDNASPLTQAGYYWFAESAKPAKALEEIALHQLEDGQVQGYAPGQWLPRVPLQCHMGLYALACKAYFMHTGDAALGRRLLETTLRILHHWERHRTRRGLVADLHTLFVDWGSHIYSYAKVWNPTPGVRTGALTAMNAYYLLVLREIAPVARFLGKDAEADRMEAVAEDLAAAMRLHLYDEALSLFRDGADHAEAEAKVSQTANALAVWAGAVDRQRGRAVLRRAFGPDRPDGMIRANAHFAYQTGSALFAVGLDRLALDWMRRGFGLMLEAGSTTLWETWESHASHCQGTGAAPAYLLGRYVAGLYPAEPGYAVVGLDPHPGDLRRLYAGLALPAGRAVVTWGANPERVECALQLPAAWRGRPVRHADHVRLALRYAE